MQVVGKAIVGRRSRLLLSGVASAVLMLFAVPHSTSAEVFEGYFSLETYMRMHPTEIQRSAQFDAIVQSPAQRIAKTSDEPIEIFVVYPGLQISDYWRRSVSSFIARLQELDIDFTLEEHFTKPGIELRLQSMLINDALKEAPDYMVFTLDALRHRGMIERVIARGSTKIILQNITTPIVAFEQNQPFMYVGFDHATGAKLLAQRFKERYPKGAKYAVLYGPQGYVSAMRGGVFINEMKNHPNSELVGSYYVNFDRERAYKAAIELLKDNERLDFIYACSTDIALGIVDALKETGRLNDVDVNGWGGGEIELKSIQAHELDFTVMRMNDDNGIAMAEAIRLDLEGKGRNLPTVYSGKFEIVDQSTSPEQLNKLKAHAFRYSK